MLCGRVCFAGALRTCFAMCLQANKKVADSGKTSKMASFKSKSLSTSQFFLDLLSAIESRAINWDLVTAGESDEDAEMNAKYTISVARKIGVPVFITWEVCTNIYICVRLCSITMMLCGAPSNPETFCDVSHQRMSVGLRVWLVVVIEYRNNTFGQQTS